MYELLQPPGEENPPVNILKGVQKLNDVFENALSFAGNC